jgi:hypothetical protein
MKEEPILGLRLEGSEVCFALYLGCEIQEIIA